MRHKVVAVKSSSEKIRSLVSAEMSKYAEFGKWFRSLRISKVDLSAADLSRAAGLDSSYISDLERGKARPKAVTVERIAKAMKLTRAERSELHKRAKVAGESAPVVRALMHQSPSAFTLWKNLPALLYEVQNSQNCGLLYESDDVASEAVRTAASLLTWVSLNLEPFAKVSTRFMSRPLAVVRAEVAKLWRGMPFVDATECSASDTKSACVIVWRANLFSRRSVVADLVSLLSDWGIILSEQASFSFKDRSLDSRFGFEFIPSRAAIALYDALSCELLWERLGANGDWIETAPAGRLRQWTDLAHSPHGTGGSALERWMLYEFLMRAFERERLGEFVFRMNIAQATLYLHSLHSAMEAESSANAEWIRGVPHRKRNSKITLNDGRSGTPIA